MPLRVAATPDVANSATIAAYQARHAAPHLALDAVGPGAFEAAGIEDETIPGGAVAAGAEPQGSVGAQIDDQVPASREVGDALVERQLLQQVLSGVLPGKPLGDAHLFLAQIGRRHHHDEPLAELPASLSPQVALGHGSRRLEHDPVHGRLPAVADLLGPGGFVGAVAKAESGVVEHHDGRGRGRSCRRVGIARGAVDAVAVAQVAGDAPDVALAILSGRAGGQERVVLNRSARRPGSHAELDREGLGHGGAKLLEDVEQQLGAAGLLMDRGALLSGRVGSVARALVDVVFDDNVTGDHDGLVRSRLFGADRLLRSNCLLRSNHDLGQDCPPSRDAPRLAAQRAERTRWMSWLSGHCLAPHRDAIAPVTTAASAAAGVAQAEAMIPRPRSAQMRKSVCRPRISPGPGTKSSSRSRVSRAMSASQAANLSAISATVLGGSHSW